MTDNAYIYVIGPVVAAVIGGIGYLVKHILSRRDKRHEEEIEERNRRRDEIEQRLTKAEQRQEKAEQRQELTERKLNNVIAIAVGCDNPDCPTRGKLSKFISEMND
ncbi:MAG: hypothetical protein IKZ67_01470 [Paludibacteraceae bacterium]|nr:hypothetical protein [Paludibacteraceae bacterium]